MTRVALRMLFGDKAKFLSLVFGLSFAVLLIAQQGSIFLGLLKRATGPLQNTAQADLWITDKNTTYIFEYRPLNEKYLLRVRSTPGVAWAEPFFSSRAQAELPGGEFHQVQVIGIDRTSLVGQPPVMLEGRLEDLRAPGAVIIEESSRPKLGNVWIGDTLKLNDRRAVVVGVCRAKLGFESNALLYTSYDNAVAFTPTGRDRLSFILAKAKDGLDPAGVARNIEETTGLGAYPRKEMERRTIRYILVNTGIGINFGITVLLGFVVGLVVVAATFHEFTLENLKYFAVFKAMGTRTRTVIGMVLMQALIVGLISYGIGVGLASIFSLTGRRPGAELAPYFPWQMLVGTLFAMLVCVSMGSVLSLRRVIRLEPAVVFK
ncbi:MAG: ABC transporter permease [Phycisphaerales bacterium]